MVAFIFLVILDYDINYINPNFGVYVPSHYGMPEIIPTAQNQSMATRLCLPLILEGCSDGVSVCSKINRNKNISLIHNMYKDSTLHVTYNIQFNS